MERKCVIDTPTEIMKEVETVVRMLTNDVQIVWFGDTQYATAQRLLLRHKETAWLLFCMAFDKEK